MPIEELFVKIFNMSLTASYVIACVIVLRLLLKKAPRWIICILWAIASFRLIFPFSLESMLSVFSVIPSSDIVTSEILYSKAPTIHTGISAINSTVNPVLSESMAPAAGVSANPMQIAAYIASVIWLSGVSVLLVYSIAAYIKLKKRTAAATLLKDNIYQSENAASPFVLGFIKPKIYIPYTLSEPELSHVLHHENAHILRHDHIVKALAFFMLALHWFNPLVWVAYLMFCRDMELACDEKVIKEMPVDARKSYSEALLALAMRKSRVGACPLAFGESNVKERIKKTLSYKKPAFWIIIAAFAACVITALCLLTDPVEKTASERESEQTTDISALYGTYHPSEVIYVNPISSFYPFDLDSTPYYTLKEGEFTVSWAGDNSDAISGVPIYSRSQMTEKEFNDLFSIDIGKPDVSQYESIDRIILTDEYSLFVMDGELWIADLNGQHIWIIYRLEPCDLEQAQEYKRLTIGELISLVGAKGDALTWSDFEKYEHYDIGSGFYIWQIPVDESFCVSVTGGGPSTPPMAVSLVRLLPDGAMADEKLDLRDKNADIKGFIDSFAEAPQELTWIFRPQISSVFPALPITIDMECSSVDVTVDSGSLYVHGNGKTQSFGKTHTYMPDEAIYWAPHPDESYESSEELFESSESACAITLAMKNSQDEIIAGGKINIRKISDESEMDYSEYSVMLDESSNGLKLASSTDLMRSFVVSLK